MIGRRGFISLLGGAAATWPMAARAQPPERVRRIGVLMVAQSANDAVVQARNAAFLQGLQEAGWVVGRNVRIEARWSAANTDEVRKSAAELAALAPDIILAAGSGSATAVQQVTLGPPSPDHLNQQGQRSSV